MASSFICVSTKKAAAPIHDEQRMTVLDGGALSPRGVDALSPRRSAGGQSVGSRSAGGQSVGSRSAAGGQSAGSRSARGAIKSHQPFTAFTAGAATAPNTARAACGSQANEVIRLSTPARPATSGAPLSNLGAKGDVEPPPSTAPAHTLWAAARC